MVKNNTKESQGSTYVYIKDPDCGWRPATLTGSSGDKATVTVPKYADEKFMTSDGGRAAKGTETKTVDLKKYAHKVLPLQNVDNQGQLVEYSDMVKLPYLHEVRQQLTKNDPETFSTVY
jgi:hypothetical protein